MFDDVPHPPLQSSPTTVEDALVEYALGGILERLVVPTGFEPQNFDFLTARGEGESEVVLGVDTAVAEEEILATSSGVPHSSFISSIVKSSLFIVAWTGSIPWRSFEQAMHTWLT